MITNNTSGAPYRLGDPVAVEVDDCWHEGLVARITWVPRPRDFGRHWLLRVRVPNTNLEVLTSVDDNGRNHTYRQQVCPSTLVLA